MTRLGAVLFLIPGAALFAADTQLEIIELKHRPIEEVIPIVQPFAGPEGTVTGMNNQLIVRTTPQRLQQIRQIIEKIDLAPRRLLITVRQAAQRSSHHTSMGANADIDVSPQGRVGVGGTSAYPGDIDQLGVHARTARTHDDTDTTQQLQVLEGRRAFIQAGVSVPIVHRDVTVGRGVLHSHDTVTYRDATTGFYVVPRLNGDVVTLEISPHMERPDTYGPGTFDVQRARTTVNGRLGEWIEVGGSGGTDTQQGSGIAHMARTKRRDERQILLKVEELP